MGSIAGLVDIWQIFSLVTLGRFTQLCLPIQSMTPNSHQSWGQTNTSPASAPLPNLQAPTEREKNSYPMHVSGHGMVEWVQRYACAKISGTVWLAGRGVSFSRGRPADRRQENVFWRKAHPIFGLGPPDPPPLPVPPPKQKGYQSAPFSSRYRSAYSLRP